MLPPASMSLSSRRNVRPPPLNLPSGSGGLQVSVDGSSLKTPIRSPMPITPLPMLDESVMTPDTAEFPKGTFWPMREWTEDEDGIIESYLAKPPRTVSQQYPPGELPPLPVIAEIARQILKFEQTKSSGWTRSYEETKSRVFHIARQESMRQVGGYHRRTPSDPKSMEDRPEISAEVDLAQVIDHVEQEMVIPEFSHSMRLSDEHAGRGTGAPLSSPLEMHFSLPPFPASGSEQPQRLPISTGLSTTAIRPASLLSRGRSFTSEDLLAEQDEEDSKAPHPCADTDMGNESDASSSRMSAGLRKLVSSPISNITNSPPSSLSSHSVAEDIEVDLDSEPYTPLTQSSFPTSIHEPPTTHEPTVTTPTGRPDGTLAAPHTVDARRTSEEPGSGTTPKQSPSAGLSEPWSAPQLARKTTTLRAKEDKPSPEEVVRDTKRQKVVTRPSHRRGVSNEDVFGPAL